MFKWFWTIFSLGAPVELNIERIFTLSRNWQQIKVSLKNGQAVRSYILTQHLVHLVLIVIL